MLPLGVDRRINQNPEYNRKNRTTYKKIKTGETQKHQNTKEKGECSGYTISAAKIIYGEDDRAKKYYQRI